MSRNIKSRSKRYQRILAIPDLHCPWMHPAAYDFLAKVKREYKPDLVVNLGDEIDAYNFSTYGKNPDLISAGQEIDFAIRSLKPLYKIFPKVYVCESNHTVRPFKRAAEAGLPGSFVKEVKSILEAPAGWNWASHWEFDGIRFTHGEGASGKTGAIDLAIKYRQSTVIGHLHTFGGVIWSAGPHDAIFGLNAGCLIDNSSAVFAYAKALANRPTLGCGLILDGVPMFLPMKG